MATVDILAAFGYKWGQDGTIEAIDDAQWKAGWSYIGATPPSVEQFNKVQQIADEKTNYLYAQMAAIFTAAGETPSAADLTSLRDALQVIHGTPGNYRGFQTISTTSTLTPEQAGVFLSITASIGVTLPPASSVPLGSTYVISQTGVGANATVQASVGDSLFALGSSTPRTFNLGGGDSIKCVKVSANSWYSFDGVQLGFAASFLGTFTGSGYQKLPSGTIFQRGAFAASASADTVVSFPIVFPNNCLQIVLSPQVTTTGIFAGYNTPTTSSFNGNAWVSSTTRANASVDFIAIGN